MKSSALLARYLGPAPFPWLTAAWRWWICEILQLMPAAGKQWLMPPADRLCMVVDAEGVADITIEGGEKRRMLGRIDLQATDGVERDGFLKAIERQWIGRRDTALRISARAALRSEISLPLSAERNLAQAVSFEARRQTPFKVEDIYYAFRVVRRDKATKQIAIELTVVQRRIVDGLIASARTLGLEPSEVRVAGKHPSSPHSPDLLDGRSEAKSMRMPAITLAALASIALLLAIVAIITPLHRMQSEIDSLNEDIARTKPLADESMRLHKDIEARTLEGGFLASKKQAAPSTSQILAELTRLLPDDTYLVEWRLSGRNVEIAGLTGSASALIGLLDKSPNFANPTFRAAVTQDQRTGHELFDIGVKYTGGLPR